MIILPAIDLKDGKCVRLYKGEFDKVEVVGKDPVQTAKKFKSAGAKFLHIVDLDGALNGEMVNLETVLKIVNEVDIKVEIGGGIRNINTVDSLLKQGIDRVILGSAALNNRSFLIEVVKKYGDKIAVGIDAKNEKVAVDGWTKVSGIQYIEFAKDIEKIGVRTIIFTDISKDGTLTGPNLQQLKKLKENVNCNIIASGGIKDIDDIKNINKMGIYGTIVGKAIYSLNVDLKSAIKVSKEKLEVE
ncbi:MAG: 1-(5-phosphoribosyl)-5-[(5-phosphoribosylamino)methylideneamino]imidazole-4-carboxamide isomerase [Clostridium sp.]|nr:1-(5-phosphoribosyl)-5-[(5-phosphoribosylamino)methylideneamino]imidazole-4-carboxamide isomerase [Clostridium sp.]